jgi:hypothetical protein
MPWQTRQGRLATNAKWALLRLRTLFELETSSRFWLRQVQNWVRSEQSPHICWIVSCEFRFEARVLREWLRLHNLDRRVRLRRYGLVRGFHHGRGLAGQGVFGTQSAMGPKRQALAVAEFVDFGNQLIPQLRRRRRREQGLLVDRAGDRFTLVLLR